MATVTFSNGQSVNFNGTPTQADIQEVATKLGINQPTSTPTAGPQSFFQKVGNIAKSVGNAFTSSEQGLGQDIAPITAQGQNIINQTNKDNASASAADLHYVQTLIQGKKNAIANGQDASHYDTALKNFQTQKGATITDLFPALAKTDKQVLGDVLGTGLDLLSAGTYGEAAKGAKAGELLVKSATAAPVIADVAKKTIGQTLQDIGIKTAQRAGVGAGTGYAYDVANNLQSGKTGGDIFKPGMGTILGGTVPALIGGVQAGLALTKDTAPRFINSLIKPKAADFSYGKDPGRTVSELGITGNSIPDFEKNITTAKQAIGSQLGSIYTAPENEGIKINAQPEIDKIDAVIQTAAKGGKENQGIVTTLTNVKNALLYEHGVDSEGNVVKIGDTPRDLTALSPKEAFDLKSVVADQTKFTGKPSDDKTVNSVLKNIYGGLKEQLNTELGKNNPEIIKLNQQYADLTSAELATRNRNAIVQRADQVSMPIKIGGAAGIITAIGTGHVGIPAILAAVGASALDKALSSTAVKTRVAAWLGSQEPSAINALIAKNPAIKEVLYRTFPKIASQLGK